MVKSKNVNKVEGLANLANLAKNTLESAKAALEIITPAKTTAAKKLKQIAEELDWPLADLLDWYKNDLADIADMELDNVRHCVKDYIKLIDLCRCEGYRPEQQSEVKKYEAAIEDI